MFLFFMEEQVLQFKQKQKSNKKYLFSETLCSFPC